MLLERSMPHCGRGLWLLMCNWPALFRLVIVCIYANCVLCMLFMLCPEQGSESCLLKAWLLIKHFTRLKIYISICLIMHWGSLYTYELFLHTWVFNLMGLTYTVKPRPGTFISQSDVSTDNATSVMRVCSFMDWEGMDTFWGGGENTLEVLLVVDFVICTYRELSLSDQWCIYNLGNLCLERSLTEYGSLITIKKSLVTFYYQQWESVFFLLESCIWFE